MKTILSYLGLNHDLFHSSGSRSDTNGPQKDHSHGVKSRLTRRLALEELEDRRLLSISTLEYESIIATSPDSGLVGVPSDDNTHDLNRIELSATDLSGMDIKEETASGAKLSVANTNDSGSDSLHQTIVDIPANDTIPFASAVQSQTITVSENEPANAKGITVDTISLEELICIDPIYDETLNGLADNTMDRSTLQTLLTASGLTLTEKDILNLNSNPGAKATIYLDFDGNTTTGTKWNTNYQETIVTPRFNLDGNETKTAFSTEELWAIYEIWLRVSEDYAPFEVNVTTKDPSVNALTYSGSGDQAWGKRVCIGGSCNDWYKSSAGGVAYLNSFYSGVFQGVETPCFVFSESLALKSKSIAEAVTHEVGHTLGLNHDGSTIISGQKDYYQGANGWCPIMGGSYYQPLTQWSKGEYSGATNKEDDLNIIVTQNGFGYKTDDFGNNIASAYKLSPQKGVIAEGLIETNTDYDYFELNITGKPLQLQISGLPGVTNLDIGVSLYDGNGNLLKTCAPSDSLYVTLELAGYVGTHYISVTGTGNGSFYSDYASLGAYTLEILNDYVDETFIYVTTESDVVNASDGKTSLREAIAIAKTGDTIIFVSSLKGKTITLAGTELAIAQGITIDATAIWDSANNKPGITISANQKSRVFNINDGSTSTKINVSLLGLSFTGGKANDGGGISCYYDSLSMTNCTGYGNYASHSGGAVYSEGTVIINDCCFEQNATYDNAGAVHNNTGTMTIIDSLFNNNLSSGYRDASSSAVENIQGNMTIIGCTFIDNHINNVSRHGSVIWNEGTLLIDRSVFRNNYSATVAGGVYVFKGNATIRNTLFASNQAQNAGAIGIESGTVDIINCTIVGNTVTNYGGGIYVTGGTAKLYNSIVVANTASNGNDIYKSSGTVQGSNNLSSFTEWSGTSSNNYTCSSGNSLFVNAANGDYRLAANSQAINKGNNSYIPSGVTTDLAGNARIIDGTVDIGAYEYGSSSSSPDVGDTFSTATTVSFSSNLYTKTEEIGNGDYTDQDIDIYKIVIASSDVGKSYVITTSLPSGGSSVDTYLKLFNASATVITYNDDGGGNIYRYSQIKWTPTAAGTYYLGVSSYGNRSYDPTVTTGRTSGATGDYTLTIDRYNANTLIDMSLSTSSPYVGRSISTALFPENATVNYQWYRGTSSSASTSNMTAISGATGYSYTPTTTDLGYYLRVVVTGTGSYTGTLYATTSYVVKTPIASVTLSTDNPTVGIAITSSYTPSNATVTYQWSRATSTNSSFSSISGATSASYTPTTSDLGYYLRLTVSGTGTYGSYTSQIALNAVAANSDLFAGYNAAECSQLRTFLEQTDANGVKNGTKLNSSYSSSEPATWTGVTWQDYSGVKRITKIGDNSTWSWKELCGELNLSSCENLTFLNCGFNKLTSLNVSNNTALTTLWCYSNNLTELDVSKNISLTRLSCWTNVLTTLDVSKNISLTALACGFNRITTLDISKNTALTTLWCEFNELTSIDVSKNTALTELRCWNSKLQTVQMSSSAINKMDIYLNVSGASTNTIWTFKNSAGTTLGTTTADADSYYQVSALPLYATNAAGTQTIAFATEDLSKLNGYNSSECLQLISFLEQTDANGVKNGTKVNSGYSSSDPATWTGVTWQDYSGVKRITKIGYSSTWYNKGLCGELNLSSCEKLTYLYCLSNNLTSLDVSKNTALEYINCGLNDISTLDLSKNTALIELYCQYNNITSLDISKNTALTKLDCGGNQITALNLSNNTALINLWCGENSISSLDVSKNTTLTLLHCWNNKLTTLDVSKNTALKSLSCWGNKYTSLDVSKNIALTYLNCRSNKFSTLDVSKNTALTELRCWNSELQTVLMSSSVVNKAKISMYGSNTSWTFKNSSGTTVGTTTTDDDSCYQISVLPLYATNAAGTQTISFITTPITTALSGITLSSNAPKAGTAITATVTPSGATVNYQWSWSSTSTGTYTNITGATAASYTPASTYVGKYLKCTATGTGNYSGSVSVTTGVVQSSEAVIHANVVVRTSLSSDDVSISLPGQVDAVRKGETVYAEVWLQNMVSGGPEISGGSLDLSYNTSVLNAITIGHGNRFTALQTGTIDHTAGLIDDLGGATFSTDQLNGQWVRLGYIEFNAIADGETSLTLAAGSMNMSLNSTGNIAWNKVILTNTVLAVERTCIYDIDNSGRIDFGDFSYFVPAFGASSGDAKWNAKCDFNEDGRIDFGDFSYFVSAFGKNVDDTSIIYPNTPASGAMSASALPGAFSDELLNLLSDNSDITEEKSVDSMGNSEIQTVSELPQPAPVPLVISNQTFGCGPWIHVDSTRSNDSGISQDVVNGIIGISDSNDTTDGRANIPQQQTRLEYLSIDRAIRPEISAMGINLDSVMANRLSYWNTRPTLKVLVVHASDRWGTASIGDNTLSMSNAVSVNIPMEVPIENSIPELNIWSGNAEDLWGDDYDFVNDETIDRYGKETSLFPEMESIL